ncbi:MAG: hypothetical protein ABJA66_15400 [Actinomycetota bacterium]
MPNVLRLLTEILPCIFSIESLTAFKPTPRPEISVRSSAVESSGAKIN